MLADELVERPVTKESWREDAQLLRPIFRRVGLRAEVEEARAARLEGETDRWAQLAPVPDVAAESVDFASMTSAREIDRELRRLVELDRRWDEVIAHHVYTLQEGGALRIHGFASTRQYVEERLGLPWRAIEKRVRLEERIWRALRVAYLLAAAMETARRRVGVPLSDGECLAIIAAHFLRTHADVANRRPTLSQRVRERDGGLCTVPGCSARADDAHHIEFLSRGGHRTAMWNQTSGCKCHQVCVHELGLRVSGEAPDALVWALDGGPFMGM